MMIGQPTRDAYQEVPLTPPVTVQLSAGSGLCWDAVYSAPIVNNAGSFKAKSD